MRDRSSGAERPDPPDDLPIGHRGAEGAPARVAVARLLPRDPDGHAHETRNLGPLAHLADEDES